MLAICLSRPLGTSLTWYGIVPNQFPYAASTGSYVVDQGLPTTFSLPGLPLNSTTTLFSQLFFKTPTYAQGNHRISVLYQGNEQTTPLTLDYLIVRNGSASTLAPTTSTNTTSSMPFSATPTISPSPTSTTGTNGKNVKAFIAGFVVGGSVLFTVISILALLYIRRRGKRLGIYSKLNSKIFSVTKVESGVQPFTELPTSGAYARVSNPADSRQSDPMLRHSGNKETVWRIQIPNFGEKARARRAVDLSVGSATEEAVSPPVHILSASTLPPLSRTESRHTPSLSSLSRVHDPDGLFPLLSDSSTSSRVFQHEDSGARMRNEHAETLLEIPPQYTPHYL